MFRQLVRDQEALANSIDVLSQQQIFKEQEKFGARNSLNTFEDVLREIFGRPSRRVKVREFQQLIKEHSSSFRPHEKKAVEAVLTKAGDEESEISVEDLQVGLATPRFRAAEFPLPSEKSPTAPSMAFPTTAASPTTVAATHRAPKEVDEIYREFKEIKASGGKTPQGVKPPMQQEAENLLSQLGTPERVEEFRALLKKEDYSSKYKFEALKNSGFKFTKV